MNAKLWVYMCIHVHVCSCSCVLACVCACVCVCVCMYTFSVLLGELLIFQYIMKQKKLYINIEYLTLGTLHYYKLARSKRTKMSTQYRAHLIVALDDKCHRQKDFLVLTQLTFSLKCKMYWDCGDALMGFVCPVCKIVCNIQLHPCSLSLMFKSYCLQTVTNY